MTLLPGTRLGGYQILGALGAGGMGEVYRARDLKLDRDVAIKVLPLAVSADPDRIARFEREAKTLAALNHPNIAHIHGLEESGSVRALVMELVHGPTLADRIAKGPIPIKEALPIARQIADALDEAHEKGIVHRDLKPVNIKITPDGVVKVLDFGLAKILAGESAERDRTESPTITVDGTRDGMILGTAPYMSPEQARGKPVDKRADIWAFGCVFYEMLTGRAAFAGATVSDTIAKILEREPDWSKLPAATPSEIKELLGRCLERDPRQRLRDIGDARADLEPNDSTRAPVRNGWRTRMLMALAAAFAVMSAVALIGWWRPSPVVRQQVIRLPVDLGPDAVNPINGSGFAISRDGTRVVYRVNDGSGTIKLFTRTLNDERATELPGTDGAISPFFSPDGLSVGFFDVIGNKLKKIDLTDRNVVELCDAPYARGGSWDDDGNIVASINARGPLYRIPANGGDPQPITGLKGGETHRWPQVLPGVHAVLFTANNSIGNFDEASIEIQSLPNGERTTVVPGAYYGRYVPTGHLLFVRHDTLYAAPFDLDKRALAGPAVSVLPNIRTRFSSGGAAFDVSANGVFLYARGSPLKNRLAWLNEGGRVEPLAAKPSQYGFGLQLSPDGGRVAVATAEIGSLDVWVYELKRDAWTRVTSSPDIDSYPVWSPDGRHIAFMSAIPSSGFGIFWRRADGTGETTTLIPPVAVTEKRAPVTNKEPSSFSPTGDNLAFVDETVETKRDIWLLPIEHPESDQPKPGRPIPFLKTRFNETAPMISPDGKYIAYQSDESGRDEIYVQPFPNGGAKWAISVGGGTLPIWARNRREIFYRSREGMMVALYTAHDGSFEPDKPRLWATKTDINGGFALSPDGARFIIIESGSSETGQLIPVTFVVNFFDELTRRVPASK